MAWIKKQEQENFYLGTLEMNLIAEFEAAEREAWNAAIEAAEKSCDDNKHPESDAVGDEWIADHNETCAGCASRIRELKK